MDSLVLFLENLTMVIGLAACSSFIVSKFPAYRKLIWGLLLGLGTVIAMHNKIMLEPGRFVDFRYLTMAFAGYFGGAESALIAASISGAYRCTQGGDGMLGGIITVFSFGFIGVYLRRYKVQEWELPRHIFLGVILTSVALIIILISPPWSVDALKVVEKAALPLFLLLPIGSYIGFKVFHLAISEEEKIITLKTFKTLFQECMVPKWTVRAIDGTIVDTNKAFEDFVGYSKNELIGREVKKLGIVKSNRLEVEIFRDCVDKSNYAQKELLIQHKCGEIRNVIVSCNKISADGVTCYFFLAQDITELRNAEIELSRLDSLNLIGEMAASISHEVRNPMTTVRGYLQYYLNKDKYSDQHRQFQTMIDELDRANLIITEFLSLAKNKIADMKVENLNDTINVLVPLIQADTLRMGHNIQINTNDVPSIQMNKNEIRQLILNLTRNGLEAMNSAGKLIIQTYSNEEHVLLKIQDTGTGISDDVLRKLGKPFFTTKEKGTGLGLMVCYRIAQRHNAKIDIDTSPAGTAFLIKFPIAN